MLFPMPNRSVSIAPLTLEDRQAIVDATILYCWAIDTRSYGELDGVFTEDVSCNFSSISPPFTGLDQLKAFIAAALDPLDLSQHMVSNQQVLVSESGPRSRCYFQAQHVRAETQGGSNYIVAGTYSDHWRKTPEGWRASERSLAVLWTEGNPAVIGI